MAAENLNRAWYTGYNGDAAADAKNSIRNSPARIQNAAAFGSVLRPRKKTLGVSVAHSPSGDEDLADIPSGVFADAVDRAGTRP